VRQRRFTPLTYEISQYRTPKLSLSYLTFVSN
jgi:hypothetical protein